MSNPFTNFENPQMPIIEGAPLDHLLEEGDLLAYLHTNSRRSDEALEQIKTLEHARKPFMVEPLQSSMDLDENAENIKQRIKEVHPAAIIVMGGDCQPRLMADGLSRIVDRSTTKKISLEELIGMPAIPPMLIQAYGTGNDLARSFHGGVGLDTLMRHGRAIDVHPIKNTVLSPDGTIDVSFSLGSTGAVFLGEAAFQQNHEGIRNRDSFQHETMKHLWLTWAMLKALVATKSVDIQFFDEYSEPEITRSCFALGAFQTKHFGIHGLTRGRFSSPTLELATIGRKNSPMMWLKVIQFLGGRMGIELPTEEVKGPISFRINPRNERHKKGQARLSRDDTHKDIGWGSRITIELAEHTLPIATTLAIP